MLFVDLDIESAKFFGLFWGIDALKAEEVIGTGITEGFKGDFFPLSAFFV